MWNKTSCAYSKNAKGSVNSAAHNNSANSASVPVKQRYRCAVRCGTRCNGCEKAHEPLKNTGSAAENYAFEKVVVTRTTGIVRILCRTLTSSHGACQQKRLHQFFETLYVVAVRWKSVSAALLIILWSSVQVTHALPFPHLKAGCTPHPRISRHNDPGLGALEICHMLRRTNKLSTALELGTALLLQCADVGWP
jgi:hypothetical protein